MLDGKLDNITKVILVYRDNTINQLVTPDTTSMVNCKE
jgi:hypothetical protein